MRKPFQIVILGAGFAGLEVAQRLAHRSHRRTLRVTLIDRQEYHVFQPLLHQVATGELGPKQVAYPIRAALRWASHVRFVRAEVVKIAREQRRVETSVGAFTYDFLVVATGAMAQRDRVPGATDYALGLKTIADAIALRRHVFRNLEQPDSSSSKQRFPANRTVVIVGGGTTGVELAAAMADAARLSSQSFPRQQYWLCHQPCRILLLHSRDHILPSFRSRSQRYALERLRHIGVEVRLETRVSHVSAEGVSLADGGFIAAKTVVWTAGVRGNPPNLEGEAIATHRLPVRSTLQHLEDDHIYVIGDVAVEATKTHAEPWSMLASVAVQQGRVAAHNLQRQIQGQRLKAFELKHWGTMAILGRHAAVIQLGPLTLTGMFAWFVWLVVHLVLLRGFSQRLTTLLRWSAQHRSSVTAQGFPMNRSPRCCSHSSACVK